MGRISGVGLAVVVAAVCLTSGCASLQTTEWTGHKIDEAIKKFGSPDRTVPAANGQTMYVFVREYSIPRSSWWGERGQPTVQTMSQKQITTWSFLVNQERTVVSWNRDEGAMY
jgi:hypothetical protein